VPEPWPAPWSRRPSAATIAPEGCAAAGTAVVGNSASADDADRDTTASVAPSATLDADADGVDIDVRSPSRDCCTAAGAAAWRGRVGNTGWSA